MTLVGYSDSEDEQNDADAVKLRGKRSREDNDGGDDDDDVDSEPASKCPPALPPSFHHLYASNVRSSTSDDPALHGGRQRQLPHTVGHWPSFVYLEWLPSNDDLAILDNVIANATSHLSMAASEASVLQSSLRSDLGVRLPLHVSLSAPLLLSTDNKDDFQQALTKAIRDAGASSLKVVPSAIRWVRNFDMSRHFLILTLNPPERERDELQKLLTTSNNIARCYNLPELYSEGRHSAVGASTRSSPQDADVLSTSVKVEDHNKFHISIAWTLQKPAVDKYLQHKPPAELGKLSICFDKVHMKVGNQISTVPLLPAENG